MSDALPLVILSGFLGAGKTTCLNAVLTARDATGVAVLVNEFGEVDVDGRLLSAAAAAGGGVVQLANGCICCTIREDLAAALGALLRLRDADPARVRIAVLETTGLADPGAIVRALARSPGLKGRVRTVRVVTVCDVPRLSELRGRFIEVDRQIAAADSLLLNKVDRDPGAARTDIVAALRAINPLADITAIDPARMDPAILLGPWPEATFRPSPEARSIFATPSPTPPAAHAAVRSFAVHLDGPLDPDRLRDALSFLILRHADRLLRYKGVVRIAGERDPVLIQGVQDIVRTDRAPDGTHPPNGSSGAIVFIGIDLPEAGIRADLAASRSDA
jgi:G3E family GTPase